MTDPNKLSEMTEDSAGNKSIRTASIGVGSLTPSQFDPNLTMEAAGVAVTLPTGVRYGAGRVKVTNLGITTEAVRVVFGIDDADALLNLTIVAGAATTGDYLPSNVDVPGAGIEKYGVPSFALSMAVGPAVAGKTNDVAILIGV